MTISGKNHLDYCQMFSQVCLKDSNNIEMDSDVSLEIPSETVIAYSILELEIKKNGHYGECVVTSPFWVAFTDHKYN